MSVRGRASKDPREEDIREWRRGAGGAHAAGLPPGHSDPILLPSGENAGYAGAPSSAVSGAHMYRQITGPVGLKHDSSLTGTFEVSLTRAVLPYRDGGER